MKEVIHALLLALIITGLIGCKSSRATLKTDTMQELRQMEAADASRTEKATTSNRMKEALSSNEQKNVVVSFEELEYYPPSDTTTGENYAHNSANFIRTGKTEAKEYKPPNAGSVKKHRKGTITINADRQTKKNSTQTKETATDVQEASDTKKTTEQATKEKTASIETNGKSKGYVWLIVGLLCAVFFVGIGIWLARRR